MAEQGSGRWCRLGYSFGNASLTIGSSPTTLLLLYYLTEIVGLRAGQAGLAVALPKVWDAMVDPMFGGWIDRLALRTGRRAPIALISGAGYLIALVFLFSLPQLQSPMQILAVAILLLILSSASETAFSVSQFALATEMSGDEAELSGLLSLSGVVGQLFFVVGAAMTPLLISWAGGGRSGYSRMALEVAALAALAILVFVASTRRVPVRRATLDGATLSLWASVRATGANRAFYFLMAFLLCLSAASAFIGSILPFANQYVLASGQNGLSVLAAVSGVTAIAGMPLAPVMVRRFGTMRSMSACGLAIAAMLGLLFLASYGPIWMSWLAIAGVGLGSGAATILLQTTIIEVALLKLGNRVPVATGFYLGIMVAGFKLGASAGSFAAGEMLELIGFVSGGAQQSALTLIWLRVGYTLIPLFGVIAGCQFLRHVRVSPPPDGDASLLAV